MLTSKEKLQAVSALAIFLWKQHDILTHTQEEGDKLLAYASKLYGYDVLSTTEEKDRAIIGDVYELARKLTLELMEEMEGEA
jgi:hypothetical protein